MAQYRTAQGKTLDMGMFTAQHEKVRAVGNMKVNARGDTIDSEGRVVQSINDKINEYYGGTVTNPGAQNAPPLPRGTTSRVVESPKAPAKAAPAPQAPQVDAAELSDVERELQESLEESIEEEVALEKSKTKEAKSKK